MRARPPLQAVLFDWGGTLSVPVEVDLLATWRAAARVLAPDDPEPVAAALLEAEHDWWRTRVAAGDLSGTTAELVAGVAARTGLERLDEALAAYHAAWEPTVAHDLDAERVLRGLRERGLRTGLLSNTHWPRDLHERWLADAGLLDLLDARVYTSDLHHVKPHPEAFLALLRQLDVDPAAAVFVGDRPRDDVSGAQGVGMRAVLLTGRPVEGWPVEPDASMPDLSGLLELVDSWR